MARVTKAALEQQIAELLLTVGAMRTRIAELEAELEATKAPAPAPAPKLAAAPAPAPSASSKAAAQAAARDAAMQHRRCTRVVQCADGTYTWEYYGRKAA